MKLYFWLFLCATLCGTFFVGKMLGQENCKAESALGYADNIANNAKNSFKILEKTNEKVYNLGLADIRAILCEKYSIKE